MCACEGSSGVQKGVSVFLELRLQAVVSGLKWVLGTEQGPLQEQQEPLYSETEFSLKLEFIDWTDWPAIESQ